MDDEYFVQGARKNGERTDKSELYLASHKSVTVTP